MRKFVLAALAVVVLVCSARAASYSFKPTVTVAVGTSATILASTPHFIMLCNTDASKTLYWSFDSAVTTSTGSPLPPGSPCLVFNNLLGNQSLYAVTTSGTLDARVTAGTQK